jgi:hypothetical protein
MKKLSERRKSKSKDPTLIQLLRDKSARGSFEEPVVVEGRVIQHEADNLWYVHLQFPNKDDDYTGCGFETQEIATNILNWVITEFAPPYNLPLKFVFIPNDGWLIADPERIATGQAQFKAAMAVFQAAPGKDLVRFMFEGARAGHA